MKFLDPFQAGPTGLLVEFALAVRFGFVGIHQNGEPFFEPLDFLLGGKFGGGAFFAFTMQADKFLRAMN